MAATPAHFTPEFQATSSLYALCDSVRFSLPPSLFDFCCRTHAGTGNSFEVGVRKGENRQEIGWLSMMEVEIDAGNGTVLDIDND